MTTLKKILLFSGLALGGLALYGYNKAMNLKSIFDKMTISPDGFSGLDVSLERIKFNLDVKITNPTSEDFIVSGSAFADLKKLFIYYKGKYIATADVDLNQVSIPHNNSIVFHNIPVVVSSGTVLDNISSLIDFSMNDITITGQINFLGSQYLIAQ